MQRKLTLDKASAFLTSKTNLILFVDTCVILDIFRVVERTKNFDSFEPYLLLAKKIKRREVILVYNETVEKEFSFNAPNVVKEQRSKIQNLNRQWNAFRSMKEKKHMVNEVKLPVDSIIKAAEGTLKTILKDSIIVKDYDAALKSSYDAVLKHRAPACRDSQFKDAYIFKTCLDLAQRSGKRIIFCTTNTKDYSDGTSGIHLDIKSQASENNVIVTFSLRDALYTCR